MKLICLVIFSVAAVCDGRAVGTNMIGRAYPYMQGLTEILRSTDRNTESPDAFNVELQRFFERTGVPFPEGSSIRLSGDYLVIWNTPENMDAFERVYWMGPPVCSQIEIDCSFVSFRATVLEDVARRAGRPTSPEDVRDLWRGGAGRLVATSKVVTRSGVFSQVKGAAEMLYPSWDGQTEHAGSQTNLNSAVGAAASFSLDVREAGLVLNVTPTVGPDGYAIDLTVETELSELLGWDDVGFEIAGLDGGPLQAHVRQPRFRSRNLTTSVVLWDGGTVVLGGFPEGDGEETIYAFLSARLIDPAGRPYHRDAAPARAPEPE